MFVLIVAAVLKTISLWLWALFYGGLTTGVVVFVANQRCRPLKYVVKVFFSGIRGTPLLVQIYLIYFGSGQWQALHNTFFWYLFKSPFYCAVIALSLNHAAYLSVIVQGVLSAMPKGDALASQGLGLTTCQSFWKIKAPKMMQQIMPAYINEAVMVMKSTALACTITVIETTGQMQAFISQTYDAALFLCLGAVIYVALSFFFEATLNYIGSKLWGACR